MSSYKSRKRTHVAFLGVLSAFVLTLAGCASNPSPDSIESSAPNKETSQIASGIPTPSTPAPVLDETTQLNKSCSDLISIEALYDFNPNFTYDASVSPEKGSLGEIAIEKSGIHCSYLNLSNGDRIDISVAQFSSTSISDWSKKLTETSRPTDTFGKTPEVLGFFSRSNNEGVSQVIQGNTWIAITSSTFYEAIDSAALMSQIQHSAAN